MQEHEVISRNYLYALVSVRHHCDKKVNEHDDRDQHVAPEDKLEQNLSPTRSHVTDVVQVR